MPNLIEQLIQAKYKNIPFLVRRETLDAIGQKRITHDYPGSSTRYVEPQGQSVLDETLEIFFHGINYITDFRDFKKILDDSSPGRLFMPTFGIFENVIAYPASAVADHTTVGEITITVTFTQTIEKPAPTEIINTQEDVAAQAQIVREEILELFPQNYEAPTAVNNIITASSDFKNTANILKNITGAIIAYNQFIRKIDQAIQLPVKIANLLLNPGQPEGLLQSIAFSVTGLEAFNIFRFISTIGNNLSNSMNDINAEIIPTVAPVTEDEIITEIDSNINLWDDDTTERQQRNNNRLTSINTFRLVGIIGMFESAAERDYTTTEQIDQVKSVLEIYYTDLIMNDETGVLIPDIRDSLDNLKNRTYEVLKQKRQNAFGITEVYIPNEIPVSLLSYMMYGEYIKTFAEFNSLIELLIGLNKQIPPHRMKGNIKVLEIG